MKTMPTTKNKVQHQCFIIFLILSSTIINSCRKDIRDPTQAHLPPNIAQAKSWYESNYPISPGSNGKTTAALKSKGTFIDLSQLIRPDWDRSETYTKKDEAIIEIPVNADSKINSTLKNLATNKSYTKNIYSRSSFLLLKDGNSYKAYIMTIIADSGYIKNDISKLTHNTYRKHDTDFSGLVLYFTPKGKYLNGYQYAKGKLVTAAVTNGATSKSKTNGNKLKINLEEAPVCIDWYLDTYVDDELVSDEYLYTTCSGGDDNSDNTGGGGAPTPPPPCTPAGGGVAYSTGKTVINKVAPPNPIGDDPGFPAPIDNPTPCIPGDNGSSTIPDFGEDAPSECLNCRVSDANFGDFLDYVTGTGYKMGTPLDGPLIVNGVEYAGRLTTIYDSNDKLAALYFSPDVTSGPFKAGTEYRVGIGPNGNPTALPTSNNDFYLGTTAPELGTGNTVTYNPPPGGVSSTYNQRLALETADNNRVLNQINQEDAADDAAANPCSGTGRSGNIRWPGTLEHWMIQFDYVANNPGALREYIIPGSSGKLNGNPGYADIVNGLTNEMFEIKPDNDAGKNAGAAEIQLYVSQGNLTCPPANGGIWRIGSNYPTRYLPDPRNPSNQLVARLGLNGVILYSSRPNNNGAPQTVPVVLPQNLADKLKSLLIQIAATPATMQQQILAFLRANPNIVPYLKSAAAGVIIATIVEDIATEGVGIADDWESFVVARTLWRLSNTIILY